MKVITLGLASFNTMYYIEHNLATAGAMVSVIPIMILYLAFQKWVVKAVVMSGVKG